MLQCIAGMLCGVSRSMATQQSWSGDEMLLYLVNPSNPLVNMSLNRKSYWNRFRLWKPLSLLVLAGLTPPDWEISIFDENVAPVDCEALPRPDVVGITAFTSQSPRAYELAGRFR